MSEDQQSDISSASSEVPKTPCGQVLEYAAPPKPATKINTWAIVVGVLALIFNGAAVALVHDMCSDRPVGWPRLELTFAAWGMWWAAAAGVFFACYLLAIGIRAFRRPLAAPGAYRTFARLKLIAMTVPVAFFCTQLFAAVRTGYVTILTGPGSAIREEALPLLIYLGLGWLYPVMLLLRLRN